MLRLRCHAPERRMNWYDALEAPPEDLAPRFFVEPRDKDPASEHKRQAEFVRRCRARGWNVTAIPNARAWGMKAWNAAKAEGAEWGASDLIVTAQGGLTAFLEFKNGSKTPEQHQVDWLNRQHRMGFPVGVFRTADCAITWLLEQGFPVRENRIAA
jgi:hypothetical protein